MVFVPPFEQIVRVRFHQPEGARYVRRAHPCDFANRLPPTSGRESNDDLSIGIPDVNVRRLVLAGRMEDYDAKTVLPQDRRHENTNLSVGF